LRNGSKAKAQVIILEDNDEAGRQHTVKILKALNATVTSIAVVAFPELPEKGDVSDWLALGGNKQLLLARAQEAGKRGGGTAILTSIRASDVSMAAVDWLWPDRFAIGKIGILAGLPDEGKSQVLYYIAAVVTRGGAWPCGEGSAPQGNVLMLTCEDDPSDTVVPRLSAAGADLTRVEIIKMVRDNGQDRMFSLADDLNLLRRKVIAAGNVAAVLIDPVSAYLGVGKVDSFRDSDVRGVLAPLHELANELRVAVVTIMHFNKKTDVTNALLRIANSLAFGAVARHVYGVVHDAENDRKLMVRAKNNLVEYARDTALAFTFAAREVGVDPRNNKPIIASYITWQSEHVDVTATEAMQAANDGKSPSARDDAKSFLEAMLSDGPKGSAEIWDAAEANGISKGTLHRVKKELNVEARKDGPANSWQWHLPAKNE
jgi:AAA domain-containing protein